MIPFLVRSYLLAASLRGVPSVADLKMRAWDWNNNIWVCCVTEMARYGGIFIEYDRCCGWRTVVFTTGPGGGFPYSYGVEIP